MQYFSEICQLTTMYIILLPIKTADNHLSRTPKYLMLSFLLLSREKSEKWQRLCMKSYRGHLYISNLKYSYLRWKHSLEVQDTTSLCSIVCIPWQTHNRPWCLKIVSHIDSFKLDVLYPMTDHQWNKTDCINIYSRETEQLFSCGHSVLLFLTCPWKQLSTSLVSQK